MASRLALPILQSVSFRGFSLYSLQPNVDISFQPGVFCLAGANGLGKSTFLAAVNFALTGLVHDPSLKFESIDDYFKDQSTRAYSQEYFEGRIQEEDRESASIAVEFSINSRIYYVRRNIFRPKEIQDLRISHTSAGTPTVNGTESLSPIDKEELYRAELTTDIGLASFQQFVFLQFFVFTFDESRMLLLWNRRALNSAIHLCVGADFQKVRESEKLLRDMERAGSRGRNINWQASMLRNDVKTLKEALGIETNASELEELDKIYKSLQNEVDELRRRNLEKKEALSDAHLKWSESNAALARLQIDYNKEFQGRIRRRLRVERHPVISTTLQEDKCAICGSKQQSSIEVVRTRISNSVCPLCSSPLPEPSEDKESIATLKELDRQIATTNKTIESSLRSVERITDEVRAIEALHFEKQTELTQFEDENKRALFQLSAHAKGAESSLQSKVNTLNQLTQKRREAYDERDRKKNEYLAIQRELERLYGEAEEEFVPLFRDLAHLFLGIPVDIRIEFGTSLESPGVGLVLEVQGAIRRQDQQLSESQRFFVDIALRMAIAQFITGHDAPSTLFIDTPEGSLDIAYESRVGQMFAQFVRKNNNLLITANINSSQILLKLAGECGHRLMSIHNMTTWTELTEVQVKEDRLFEQALADIQDALERSVTK